MRKGIPGRVKDDQDRDGGGDDEDGGDDHQLELVVEAAFIECGSMLAYGNLSTAGGRCQVTDLDGLGGCGKQLVVGVVGGIVGFMVLPLPLPLPLVVTMNVFWGCLVCWHPTQQLTQRGHSSIFFLPNVLSRMAKGCLFMVVVGRHAA